MDAVSKELPVFQLDAQAHWLCAARRKPSPNCDARPAATAIDLLVIHSMSLPPGKFGGHNIDRLFTNTLACDAHPYFERLKALRVSAHLMIDRHGDVTQYVPFHKRAWHAGQSAFRGRRHCNDFSIGIELEGTDDMAYEGVQYRALAGVIKALRQRWPCLVDANIRGHCHVAPGRKTDPGPSFDWTYLYALLAPQGQNIDAGYGKPAVAR